MRLLPEVASPETLLQVDSSSHALRKHGYHDETSGTLSLQHTPPHVTEKVKPEAVEKLTAPSAQLTPPRLPSTKSETEPTLPNEIGMKSVATEEAKNCPPVLSLSSVDRMALEAKPEDKTEEDHARMVSSPPRLRRRRRDLEGQNIPTEKLAPTNRVREVKALSTRSGRVSRSSTASKAVLRGKTEQGDTELHQLVQCVQDSISTQFQESSMGASSDFEVSPSVDPTPECEGEKESTVEEEAENSVSADTVKGEGEEAVSAKAPCEEVDVKEVKIEEKAVPRKRGRPKLDPARRLAKAERSSSRQARRDASKEQVMANESAPPQKAVKTDEGLKSEVHDPTCCEFEGNSRLEVRERMVEGSLRKNTPEGVPGARVGHLTRKDSGDESVDMDALLREFSIEEQTHLLHMYQRKLKKKRFVQQPSRRRGGMRKSARLACGDSGGCESVDALAEALSSTCISKQTTLPSPNSDAVPSIFRIVKYLRPKRTSERPLRQAGSAGRTEPKRQEKEDVKPVPAKKKPKKQVQVLQTPTPESSAEVQTPPSGDRCLPLKKRHCLLSDEKSLGETKEPKAIDPSERRHLVTTPVEGSRRIVSEANETPFPSLSEITPMLTKGAKKALFPIVSLEPLPRESKVSRRKQLMKDKKKKPHPVTKRISRSCNLLSLSSVHLAIENCAEKFPEAPEPPMTQNTERPRSISRSRSRSPAKLRADDPLPDPQAEDDDDVPLSALVAQQADRCEDEAVTLVEDDSDPDNPLKKISLLKQKQQKLLKAVERARRSKERQHDGQPVDGDEVRVTKRHRKRKMRNRTGFVKVKRKRIVPRKVVVVATALGMGQSEEPASEEKCDREVTKSPKEETVAEERCNEKTDGEAVEDDVSKTEDTTRRGPQARPSCRVGDKISPDLVADVDVNSDRNAEADENNEIGLVDQVRADDSMDAGEKANEGKRAHADDQDNTEKTCTENGHRNDPIDTEEAFLVGNEIKLNEEVEGNGCVDVENAEGVTKAAGHGSAKARKTRSRRKARANRTKAARKAAMIRRKGTANGGQGVDEEPAMKSKIIADAGAKVDESQLDSEAVVDEALTKDKGAVDDDGRRLNDSAVDSKVGVDSKDATDGITGEDGSVAMDSEVRVDKASVSTEPAIESGGTAEHDAVLDEEAMPCSKGRVKSKVKVNNKAKLEKTKAGTKANLEGKDTLKGKSRVESKAKWNSKPKLLSKAKAGAKAKVEAKAKLEAKAKVEVKAKVEAKSKVEAKPKIEGKTKVEAKAKVETRTKVESEAKVEGKAKVESKARGNCKAKVEAPAKAEDKAKASKKSESNKTAADEELPPKEKQKAEPGGEEKVNETLVGPPVKPKLKKSVGRKQATGKPIKKADTQEPSGELGISFFV